MRSSLAIATLLLLSVVPVSLLAQQGTQTPPAPQRDPQAISVLTQCLNASGGRQAIQSIHDFTGTGTVTYFWANEEVQGTVTVRRLGAAFRLDASLPDGTRSWLVSEGNGAIRETDGKVKEIMLPNALNLADQTFPFPGIVAALEDATHSTSLAGQTTLNGRSVYIIRVQKTFPDLKGPADRMSKWTAKEYLIDAQTFTLLEMRDTVHTNEGPDREFPRETVYSDFRTVNGALIPFSVAEKIDGQDTWTLKLANVTFNTGLELDAFKF